jgi:hypothetical protein
MDNQGAQDRVNDCIGWRNGRGDASMAETTELSLSVVHDVALALTWLDWIARQVSAQRVLIILALMLPRSPSDVAY